MFLHFNLVFNFIILCSYFFAQKNPEWVVISISHDGIPPSSPNIPYLIWNEGCVINMQPTFRILSITLFISNLCRLSFLRIDTNVFSIIIHHIRTESKFRWQICGAIPSIGEYNKINQTKKKHLFLWVSILFKKLALSKIEKLICIIFQS